MDRIIGSFEGTHEGPLVIVFAGMHGNEPAGIKALHLVFKMLEIEPITNPDFEFCGKLIGLVGNLKASQQRKRYINKDINRNWKPDHISALRSGAKTADAEDEEILAVLDLIEAEVKKTKPNKLIILDLHTTSSEGGIFAIPTDDPESVRIAIALHAPVIKGMLAGLKGTTLHYFNTENMGVPTTAVTFESGQHQDPQSVNRAIAGVINCIRTVTCVAPIHIENRHDEILKDYSRDLPKVSQLIYRHPVKPTDNFEMVPNVKTFQKVKNGEILAYDISGKILAPKDSHILMPLYQKQGEDGFFLVEEIEGY